MVVQTDFSFQRSIDPFTLFWNIFNPTLQPPGTYHFSKTRIDSVPPIFLTAGDGILNSFSDQYRPRLFTIEFIKRASRLFVPIPFLIPTPQILNAIVMDYYTITGLPCPVDDGPVRKTIEHYLGFGNNLQKLQSDLDSLKRSCLTSLQAITVSSNGRPSSKLSLANAQTLVQIAETAIANDVKSYVTKPSFTAAINPADGGNTSPYYTIDAGIILEADAIAALDKIGPLYLKETGQRFNVNSGTRDAYRQADAMYGVYEGGDRTLHLYKNRTVVNELLAIIKKGESRAVTVQKMGDLLKGYADKGIRMSSHQKAGAIDISIFGDSAAGIPAMTGKQEAAMMKIARDLGFKPLRENSPPHIHITFK